MTKYLKIYLLFFLTISLVACEKEEEQGMVYLDVTNANLHGTWKLSEWSGEPMNDTRYCYIDFSRSEETFIIYENIGSMYAQKLTGSYRIKGNKGDGYQLTGTYDYTGEQWKGYHVVSLTNTQLQLRVDRSEEDILIYDRCEEVPDKVIYE